MTNTNNFFASDDDEIKDDNDMGFEIEEDTDLNLGDIIDKEEEELADDADDSEYKEDEEDIFSEVEELKEKKKDKPKEEKELEQKEDSVTLSKSKIILIKKLLQNAKENNEKVMELLSVFSTEESDRALISQLGDDNFKKHKGEDLVEDGNIIEGVFDGENMIGPDGKEYSIPANYASKSKLVEGDILKLTILNNGTFIYKQIGPIDRDRIVGTLQKGSNGQFVVINSDNKKWRILTASVTYFKGSIGDEVIILVPKNADSQWAAVDNIVHNKEY